MEPRTARLDRDMLNRATARLTSQLALHALGSLGLIVLAVFSLSLALDLDVPALALPALALALLTLLPGRVLHELLADRFDALARHYLLLAGLPDQAATESSRRPWRDAIESAFRR